jgi:hypothetical protein
VLVWGAYDEALNSEEKIEFQLKDTLNKRCGDMIIVQRDHIQNMV